MKTDHELSSSTYCLRARDYRASIGRFLTEDSHWHPSNMIYGDNPNSNNPMPDIYAINQSTNLYSYCMNNPLSFIDPTGEDFIWLTAKHSAPFANTTLGHASALVQDENKDWYYFYAGPNHVLLEKVGPYVTEEDGIRNMVNPMISLDRLNYWLANEMGLGKRSDGASINYAGTSNYTDAVYIEGDFTKSFDYYKELTDKYNLTGQFDNDDYNKYFNNCLHSTYRGFVASEGSYRPTYFKTFNMIEQFYENFPLTPNWGHKHMAYYFGNSSFTKP